MQKYIPVTNLQHLIQNIDSSDISIADLTLWLQNITLNDFTIISSSIIKDIMTCSKNMNDISKRLESHQIELVKKMFAISE